MTVLSSARTGRTSAGMIRGMIRMWNCPLLLNVVFGVFIGGFSRFVFREFERKIFGRNSRKRFRKILEDNDIKTMAKVVCLCHCNDNEYLLFRKVIPDNLGCIFAPALCQLILLY